MDIYLTLYYFVTILYQYNIVIVQFIRYTIHVYNCFQVKCNADETRVTFGTYVLTYMASVYLWDQYVALKCFFLHFFSSLAIAEFTFNLLFYKTHLYSWRRLHAYHGHHSWICIAAPKVKNSVTQTSRY